MGDVVLDANVLIEPGSSDVPRFFVDILDVIEESAGVLNFNDALLVVLQRNAIIDDVASFLATARPGQVYAVEERRHLGPHEPRGHRRSLQSRRPALEPRFE